MHLGRQRVAGPVAIPLCGPCVSGAHGKVTVTAKVRTALLGGGAYVNVHTAKNAAGEIRGQVAGPHGVMPVPPKTSTSGTTTSGGYGYQVGLDGMNAAIAPGPSGNIPPALLLKL